MVSTQRPPHTVRVPRRVPESRLRGATRPQRGEPPAVEVLQLSQLLKQRGPERGTDPGDAHEEDRLLLAFSLPSPCTPGSPSRPAPTRRRPAPVPSSEPAQGCASILFLTAFSGPCAPCVSLGGPHGQDLAPPEHHGREFAGVLAKAKGAWLPLQRLGERSGRAPRRRSCRSWRACPWPWRNP
jgi:hypothetical protein